MEVLEVYIPHRKNDVFRLYPFGDWHLGSNHCSEKHIYETTYKITEDPYALVLDMGDSADLITPSDPRWDEKGIAPWVEHDNIGPSQKDRYVDLMKYVSQQKVGDTDQCKVIGKLMGGHEIKMRRRSHYNFQKEVCKALRIKDLGFSCLIRLRFDRATNRKTILIHATHGSGNAQTKGGKTQKLHKIMAQTTSRITLVGHMHDIIISDGTKLGLGAGGGRVKMKSIAKIGAITGSFLRTYTQDQYPGYGEERNYDPVPIGYPLIEFTPFEDKIAVSKEVLG